MASFVETSQPLFLQPPPLLGNGLMIIVAMVTGIEVIHVFSNINFHAPKPSWLWTLL